MELLTPATASRQVSARPRRNDVFASPVIAFLDGVLGVGAGEDEATS